MKNYPKIYLTMDNCVFYKRFCRPEEWAEKMKEMGVYYVEASADTELDPLYMGPEYLRDWKDQVQAACDKYGIHIGNLYSGHGTYTTLGMAHYDERVRRNMVENWFFPMVDMCSELDCGLGFYAHAFNQDVLQSKETYDAYVDLLYDQLAAVNSYAGEKGCKPLNVEKMYTPHQFPWRMTDIHDMVKEVSGRSGRGFYFTEDLGHHHIKFVRPTREDAERFVQEGRTKGLWLGTDKAFDLWDEGGLANWQQIEAEMDANPQVFSPREDGDCYEMLRRYGCYAPIIHLQQTNGLFSEHRPFTPEENAKGRINGADVLRALKESYDAPEEAGMPPRVENIYLTLELFSGTTSIMHDVLADCAESVRYWRQFIPEDGMELDKLTEILDKDLQ